MIFIKSHENQKMQRIKTKTLRLTLKNKNVSVIDKCLTFITTPQSMLQKRSNPKKVEKKK